MGANLSARVRKCESAEGKYESTRVRKYDGEMSITITMRLWCGPAASRALSLAARRDCVASEQPVPPPKQPGGGTRTRFARDARPASVRARMPAVDVREGGQRAVVAATSV